MTGIKTLGIKILPNGSRRPIPCQKSIGWPKNPEEILSPQNK